MVLAQPVVIGGQGVQASEKLCTVLEHVAKVVGPSCERQAEFDAFRNYALAVDSAIWARLLQVYWAWSWRPLRGVLSACDEENRTAKTTLDAFWHAPTCCLDATWSLWLRDILEDREQLETEQVQSWLRDLQRKGLTTNMSLEGLLLK